MKRRSFERILIPAGLALCLAACSGSDGKPCTISLNDAGAQVMVCPNGSTATLGSPNVVIPKNDAGATNCTISSSDGGAKKIVCPDGTEVVIPSGGTTSTTASGCTMVSNDDGTSTVTCPGIDGGTTTVTVKSALADFASMTADQLAALDLKATITSITVPASGTPVIAFRVTDSVTGNGVKGIIPTAMRFALLKLVPATTATGGNDTWVSYMAANATSTASTESPASTSTAGTPTPGGSLIDNGDGSYSYTFLKNVTNAAAAGTTYDATATHRFAMQISQSANGLQVFAPVNAVKDFIPATGQDVTGANDKVNGAACLECHSSFRAKAGGTGAFHGGSRYDVRFCAACHNDQQRFAALPGTGATPNVDLDAPGVVDATGKWAGNAWMINGDAFINFPVFIHKLHRGEELSLNGGSYTAVTTPYEITYPQDTRNCDKCHSLASAKFPQADTWKNNPSRRACASCHDGVSFLATTAIPAGRTAHLGGPMADDSKCILCHPANGAKTKVSFGVVESHVAIAPPDPAATWLGGTNANTNIGYVPAAGAAAQIPGAVQLSYNVKSVTRDANKHPSITFQFLVHDPIAKTDTPVVFNTYAAGVTTELMDGFTNSPSAYFAYAVPQDGIAAPADFNVTFGGYIKSIWNGTATNGTMTGPDATGFYTVTLTATVPDSAVMLTGGIGYTYGLSASGPTPPLTQINLADYPYGDSTVIPGCITGQKCGGLVVTALDVAKVATDATTGKAYAARRPVVSNDKCLKCHEQLGANPSFHAGQRNDGATCAFCHNPDRTSSGWSASSSTFIHGIHGASKRTVDFNWHAACPPNTSVAAGTCTKDNADPYFAKVTYPGILNNCQQCHLAGTYDFTATASAAALPNLLMSTVGTGTYTADISTSPYVKTDGTDYGTGFSTANLTSGTKDGVACTTAAPCVCTLASPCEASATTLVKSPITAACATCHDSPNEIKHIESMGGTFYGTRLAANAQSEMCMMCHGPGTVAAIADVHK